MTKKTPKCCQNNKEPKGLISGIIYGIFPHTFCILFIVGAILGSTLMMSFFKPLLMNRYFFHFLILVSICFALISSIIYLHRKNQFNMIGIKNNKKYITTMFATTIGVNLLLFLFIFPLTANFANATDIPVQEGEKISYMSLKVDIPCSGHAPLISNELKTIEGTKSVNYKFPNYFEIQYLSGQRDKILNLEVFKEYEATIIKEN